MPSCWSCGKVHRNATDPELFRSLSENHTPPEQIVGRARDASPSRRSSFLSGNLFSSCAASAVGCDWHSERRQRYSGRRDRQTGGECRRHGQFWSRHEDNTNVFGRRDRQPGGECRRDGQFCSRREDLANAGRRTDHPVTPVAGLIFETKNREIFLERFFWREITAREQLSRAVILEKF